MTPITFHKVTVLPPTPEPDAMYVKQVAGGKFVLAFTDSAGNVAELDAATSGLGQPDLVDETDATHFYFGWDFGNTWLVQRQTRATSLSLSASAGYTALEEAWPNRGVLTYG